MQAAADRLGLVFFGKKQLAQLDRPRKQKSATAQSKRHTVTRNFKVPSAQPPGGARRTARVPLPGIPPEEMLLCSLLPHQQCATAEHFKHWRPLSWKDRFALATAPQCLALSGTSQGLLILRSGVTGMLERLMAPNINCAPAAAFYRLSLHSRWQLAADQWFCLHDPVLRWRTSESGWLRLFAALSSEESAACG